MKPEGCCLLCGEDFNSKDVEAFMWVGVPMPCASTGCKQVHDAHTDCYVRAILLSQARASVPDMVGERVNPLSN